MAFAQDVHVHGHAELAIALDPSGALVAEFRSPWANIVGFEHEAHTEEEQAAVAEANAQLLDGDALFTFSEAAGCSLTVAAFYNGADAQDEGEDEHDHHHHHGDEGEEEAVHSDVAVTYSYTCETPGRLSDVSVTFFGHFPAIEEIDFVYLDDNSQVARELTPNSPRAAW